MCEVLTPMTNDEWNTSKMKENIYIFVIKSKGTELFLLVAHITVNSHIIMLVNILWKNDRMSKEGKFLAKYHNRILSIPIMPYPTRFTILY